MSEFLWAIRNTERQRTSAYPNAWEWEAAVPRVLRRNLLAAVTRWGAETGLGAFRDCPHALPLPSVSITVCLLQGSLVSLPLNTHGGAVPLLLTIVSCVDWMCHLVSLGVRVKGATKLAQQHQPQNEPQNESKSQHQVISTFFSYVSEILYRLKFHCYRWSSCQVRTAGGASLKLYITSVIFYQCSNNLHRLTQT